MNQKEFFLTLSSANISLNIIILIAIIYCFYTLYVNNHLNNNFKKVLTGLLSFTFFQIIFTSALKSKYDNKRDVPDYINVICIFMLLSTFIILYAMRGLFLNIQLPMIF